MLDFANGCHVLHECSVGVVLEYKLWLTIIFSLPHFGPRPVRAPKPSGPSQLRPCGPIVTPVVSSGPSTNPTGTKLQYKVIFFERHN